jgi:hypothetical protein
MTGPRVRRRWPRRGNEADRRYDQIGKLAVISDLDCHSRGSRLEKGRDLNIRNRLPILLVALFIPVSALAQNITGTIVGTVKDGSGAALPNATTKITEAVTVQFRAEFFNLPDHPNFGNPAANISVPSTVGSIFGAGDLRQISYGLKVLF